ncbi:TPA: DNA gyrase subunit A, partial [Streptococcus pyogenes]
LLVNGATGIAVGMATNIPPHNLAESIDAVKMVMEHPDCTTRELMEVIPGPDFPTGALVMGRSGIHRAYDTGKGSIVLRSRTEIETTQTGRERIVVTEFPYGVNKTKVHEHIVRLAQEKRLEGITAVRDESSREGVRFVIEIRREASATVILNNLFKLTSLQTNFSFNMLAIENGVPKILSLRQIIDNYISHQKEVIIRRTRFDKDKAEARAHILEGLLIALDHLDEVIAIIRNSETDVIAQTELMSRFDLSERQSQAILDMRLRRLTGLERDKIQSEYDDLLALIADLSDILAKPERIITIIKEEMDEIKRKYANPRRTELMVGEVLSLEDEDLIEEEDVLITLSNKGYIKRLAQDEFRAQKRGGRGVQGTGVNNDDFVRELISTSTHDTLLFFTNFGRVYRLKAYEIPEYGRTAKGLPIVNLLKLEDGETIQTIINARKEETAGKSFFFTTKQGIVKRTEVSEFNNIRQNGLRALKLKEGDQLINVLLTSGQDDIIIGTHSGYSVRFNEASIRNMGRSATGVRGVKLREDDRVVGASRIQDNQEVLVITENGFGKRTSATDYPTKGRGGKGIKTANITPKNGQLAGLVTVDGTEDIMVITNKGVIIRTNVANISQTGRATLGVKIMKLDADAKIVTFTLVQPEDSSIAEINTDRENSISKNKDN